ncbi:hypothetical protein [Billgrantia sp. C5P2]|uniref:hypothetical protein n=1 Tax=Billgrantia sp. C5P2 TaxID=3436239 RepID=UPI003DA63496
MEQQPISALQEVNGTILHLGAGECRELETYLATEAEQIVLVEPAPEAAQALRQRTADEPRVKVIEAAVSSLAGGATLYYYNLPGLATLHPLKPLPTKWPGLREISQVNVKAYSLDQLMEQVTMAEGRKHWLVIETPGEESHVLRAIRDYEVPLWISHLSLYIGILTPQVDQTRPALLKTLEEASYRLVDVVTQADQFIFHAKAGALKVHQEELHRLKPVQLLKENQRLQNENQALSEKMAQAEAQLNLMEELILHGVIHE